METRARFAAAAGSAQRAATRETHARTKSMLALRAVACWYKAGSFGKARELAGRWLLEGFIADGDALEMRGLVDLCDAECADNPK